MLVGSYIFQARFLEAAYLPPYKGSTFRGAFGHALKKVLCSNREGVCKECILNARCLYARTFEAPLRTGANGPTPPQPYVIEPPLDTDLEYLPDDIFIFNLLLFGDINDYLPYFIYAFEFLGEKGLGAKRNDGRGRYKLETVSCAGEIIYSNETRQLTSQDKCKQFINFDSPAYYMNGNLYLTLQTPLRFKFNGFFQTELTFQMLIRAMLRRISTIFTHFDDGEPNFDYKNLIHKADEIQCISNDTYWHDWTRYSNRQETSMNFGGLVGNATYQGNIGVYIPLFKACKLLHIGKQSTFGLGKIDYRYND